MVTATVFGEPHRVPNQIHADVPCLVDVALWIRVVSRNDVHEAARQGEVLAKWIPEIGTNQALLAIRPTQVGTTTRSSSLIESVLIVEVERVENSQARGGGVAVDRGWLINVSQRTCELKTQLIATGISPAEVTSKLCQFCLGVPGFATVIDDDTTLETVVDATEESTGQEQLISRAWGEVRSCLVGANRVQTKLCVKQVTGHAGEPETSVESGVKTEAAVLAKVLRTFESFDTCEERHVSE